jgi:hypothetical protein
MKNRLYAGTLLGIIGIAAGSYASNAIIWNLSIGLTAVTVVGYLISSYKQKKWMKYMHEKRKK